MKLAFVEGLRREAQPGLVGQCPGCASPMVPKCGERRVWHWAHCGVRHCDHWWEPETEWHRAWKNKFPAEWQEIVQRAENGERHIADVKTSHGRVVEFQHSYLRAEERRSRETFYGSMIWVVNGLRLERDKPSFYEALRAGRRTEQEPLKFLVPSNRCSLLRNWDNRPVSVFFDFGTAQEEIDWFGEPILWRSIPKRSGDGTLLSPIPVANFLETLWRDVPLKGVRGVLPTPVPNLEYVRVPYRPGSFEEYMAQKARQRSRRRM